MKSLLLYPTFLASIGLLYVAIDSWDQNLLINVSGLALAFINLFFFISCIKRGNDVGYFWIIVISVLSALYLLIHFVDHGQVFGYTSLLMMLEIMIVILAAYLWFQIAHSSTSSNDSK